MVSRHILLIKNNKGKKDSNVDKDKFKWIEELKDLNYNAE